MNELREKLNSLGSAKEPFLFVVDYEVKNFYVSALKDLDDDIKFLIDNPSIKTKKNIHNMEYIYQPVSIERYKNAFNKAIKEIESGNTYLLNLTFPSELNIDASLEEIYDYTDAKFKLYFKDEFVCFTPERFVEIKNNKIYTYPMKGTISANIENAKEIIMNDEKEMAEHTMVVDLLRNDLGMVSKKVRVDKFRYIDKIKAGERELLQVSSKISGELEDNWASKIGDILTTMLPAGSITGTPKRSTTEIIKALEGYNRGYFSGVFGVFDGENLDSAIMIRFIEKQGDKLIYKSGGGITIDSDLSSEYLEMCQKIYVPFF
jgi:para-aminobenzoate synthetase component 1